DMQALFHGLLEGIPTRLFVVGLWNLDEEPETPNWAVTLHDPHDESADLLPLLRRLFPRPFRTQVQDCFGRLAHYLLTTAHHLRQPFNRFELRVQNLGRVRSDRLRWFCYCLPAIVEHLSSDRSQEEDSVSRDAEPAQRSAPDTETLRCADSASRLTR